MLLVSVDIISAIEFDKSGDHLATGDRGGRVVLFERTDARGVSTTVSKCLFFLA
jgi:serine/threonine-protein phosphatase 2A regulatory subunit B